MFGKLHIWFTFTVLGPRKLQAVPTKNWICKYTTLKTSPNLIRIHNSYRVNSMKQEINIGLESLVLQVSFHNSNGIQWQATSLLNRRLDRKWRTPASRLDCFRWHFLLWLVNYIKTYEDDQDRHDSSSMLVANIFLSRQLTCIGFKWRSRNLNYVAAGLLIVMVDGTTRLTQDATRPFAKIITIIAFSQIRRGSWWIHLPGLSLAIGIIRY